ncbi:hypothetical protein ABT404_03480 [Streptomyces hyaluromycini]|uniref:Uncharacterized protein n=1 Tax=Streptomyces hyaluromycini TaxID=1377993 RepID=A0ABV1WNW8_9ACTN
MSSNSGDDLTFSRKVVGGLIGAMNNTHAETHHYAVGHAADMDEATEQLLRAVRELQADLQRVRATDQTTALVEALAETEDEITATGQAGPTHRERLRELLSDSQALMSILASAGALAGLLGM